MNVKGTDTIREIVARVPIDESIVIFWRRADIAVELFDDWDDPEQGGGINLVAFSPTTDKVCQTSHHQTT